MVLEISRLVTVARTGLSAIVPWVPSNKVFAIGYNKSGTHSLHQVFVRLGYTAAHNTRWRKTSDRVQFYYHDFFSDGPPDDFRALDRRFRGAKFILNVRDLDTWIDSRLEHIKAKAQAGAAGMPNSPFWAVTDVAVTAWVRDRNRYISDVLGHFAGRKKDFLIINYPRDPNATGKISGFIGRSETFEKPKEYVRRKRPGELINHERITRCLNDLGIPKADWKTDLLCPSLLPEATQGKWPSDSSELHRFSDW